MRSCGYSTIMQRLASQHTLTARSRRSSSRPCGRVRYLQSCWKMTVALPGSASLKPFLPFPAFRKTGMLTYFLAPE